jgi:hypothetical protein
MESKRFGRRRWWIIRRVILEYDSDWGKPRKSSPKQKFAPPKFNFRTLPLHQISSCDSVWSNTSLSTFRRNLPPLSSEPNSWLKQQEASTAQRYTEPHPRRWYPSSGGLHGYGKSWIKAWMRTHHTCIYRRVIRVSIAELIKLWLIPSTYKNSDVRSVSRQFHRVHGNAVRGATWQLS